MMMDPDKRKPADWAADASRPVLSAVVALMVWSAALPIPPASAAPSPITFTDVAAAEGVLFQHVSGATDEKLLPET
ncbi:MAG: hypothetical protein O2782_22135, partial [bacterium]|nr:hypothetical protein [bacterium]